MSRSSSPKLTSLLNELKTEAIGYILLFEQHKLETTFDLH